MRKRDLRTCTAIRRRIQQWAFERLYRWGRWLYDPLTWILFGDEWDSWRQAVVPFIERGPVLDLACGTGALLDRLAVRGFPAVGVDRSPSMLDGARRQRSHGFSLVRADARALPFADGSFCAVVSTFPAPFILEAAVREEVARVLQPGGIFAVVVGGRIDRWSAWRLPLRLALSVFYGRTRGLEGRSIGISHPKISGAWEEVASRRGRAFVWVARRA